MDIFPLGHSSFKLRGKTATLVTDPYDDLMVGLKFPKNVEADIVTISHDHEDHNKVDRVLGSPYVVRGQGEYEIRGVGIVGISGFHDAEKGGKRGKNTMYRIEIDGMVIVHFGDIGHALTKEHLADLDGVDILFIPVGGVYTNTPTEASAIVHEMEPSIVIPMHYGRSELNQKNFSGLSECQSFLKEMGKSDFVPQPKLSITQDKLPEQMQVVVLE